MRFTRTVTHAVASLALVLTMAACGDADPGVASPATPAGAATTGAGSSDVTTDGGTPADAGTEADPTSDDPTSDETSAVAEPVTREIGKTGWYGGFAITVVDATAEADFSDSVLVTVNFTYENLGTENDTPAEASIQIDGEVVSGFFDSPGVPGEGTAKGTATFDVSSPSDATALTFDEALDLVTLVYGDAGDNQTEIPLADSGAVESIEPITLTAAGQLTQGQIIVDLVSATLVPSYETGEEGKGLLNIRFKLTCAPGCQAQGYAIDRTDFSVTGPDGSSVVADVRSDYCCDALYPETVSDDARNIVTFVVDLPGTGDYTLTYSQPDLTAAGTAPATLAFTA